MGLRSELGIVVTESRGVLGALRRGTRSAVASRPGAWLAARSLHHLDRGLLRLTRGRTSVTDLTSGLPTVILTTTGARSGLPRRTPLVAVPLGEDLAVIGSNFGGAGHPGWVHNLLAQPRAALTRGRRQVEVVAEEAAGELAEQIWSRARTMYDGYRRYPERTGGRVIRVFVLRPAQP